ncbi:Serine/threonine-protein kinase PknF [Mycobacterium attenuatum]|uniref:serine/threonine protein kinase n=1 Tax=Mycobacterium attenuatum TaxID=2341086 RepID=UPI000F040374|nr:serine/threonine-protein kinase [Mycobacterium attenuatum]VBA53462.1 Serine/threonine-protein kinase PknF [Mycobacterium attenuatum]
MSLKAGEVFAGYTILRVLGAGGMGQVYLAKHPRLPREDALKVLPADLTNDPEYRARFMREADLAAGLSHPHTVAIHDRGEYEGHLWISMEYVAGTDAGRLLREQFSGGMPVEEALPIITAVASALDYAHHRGLLHRDVKPANILLTEPDGQPRRVFLADFGIARRIDDAAGLTRTNMAVGTVAYAAPEQLMGEPLDGRADQYALACTAFHLLAGVPPYGGPNLAVVIGQHVSAAPPSIGTYHPELAGLDPVFTAALAKQPCDRFNSCVEFADQIDKHLDGTATDSPGVHAVASRTPILARVGRRPGVLMAALVSVAVLIAAGVLGVITLVRDRAPAAIAGPLNGIYRTDFGAIAGPDDAPDPTVTTALSATYGLRSVCRSATCVATATRLGGASVTAPTLVFDEIGGRWVAVALASGECRGATAEFWQVFTLQRHADGTLVGEYTATARNVCADKRTVTFTRTGDDVAAVPDPAGQRPRVPSPAEALHGSYHVTRTFKDVTPQRQSYLGVQTYCLRTGDRCISYFHGTVGGLPLVFSGDKWTLDIDDDVRCAASDDLSHVKITAQYPLPQPLQDPIRLLTGHGHQQQSGSCAVDADFDETFTRAGD